MKIDYFSKIRVLDGGMGQLMLSKGLKPKGSLWSGTALIDKKYHQMVIDSHLDFIKSGADVIVTNNFAGRRVRRTEKGLMETSGSYKKRVRRLGRAIPTALCYYPIPG